MKPNLPSFLRGLIWSLFGLIVCFPAEVVAQDPFFTHFYGNESSFNPAMTGFRGALSLVTKHKTQWAGLGVAHFRTTNATLEESLPCSIFDWGLNIRSDREGEGLFKTMDFGFRLAGTIPWDLANSRHNLRLGAGLQWSFKGIDYSQLRFSDEIDAKYGFIFPTNFVPPNDGRSLWFFTPSVGFTYRVLLDETKTKSPTIQLGAALHNAYGIGDNQLTGNEESILQIGTKMARRLSYFASVEFLPYYHRNVFLAIRPMVLHERQAGISYWEMGSRFSVNRLLALGVYYHRSDSPAAGQNTDWLSFNLELGEVLGKSSRIDLGFSYSNSFNGLRNAVGPILEFTLAYHIADSPSCRWSGYGDEIPYGNRIKCPTSAQTPGRKKMYESIWYKTIHQN